jgi:hypothetical protein
VSEGEAGFDPCPVSPPFKGETLAKRGRPPRGFVVESDLPELYDLWNRAMASPHGIAIPSEKPNRLAQKLYAARRDCGHQSYSHLRIVELENEVRIVPR